MRFGEYIELNAELAPVSSTPWRTCTISYCSAITSIGQSFGIDSLVRTIHQLHRPNDSPTCGILLNSSAKRFTNCMKLGELIEPLLEAQYEIIILQKKHDIGQPLQKEIPISPEDSRGKGYVSNRTGQRLGAVASHGVLITPWRRKKAAGRIYTTGSEFYPRPAMAELKIQMEELDKRTHETLHLFSALGYKQDSDSATETRT